MTAYTVTDVARLRAELTLVRARRFAAAVDELELGLAAIAAPVIGAGGKVIAALSISGPDDPDVAVADRRARAAPGRRGPRP